MHATARRFLGGKVGTLDTVCALAEWAGIPLTADGIAVPYGVDEFGEPAGDEGDLVDDEVLETWARPGGPRIRAGTP